MGKVVKPGSALTPAPEGHLARRVAELAAAMPELEQLSPSEVDTVMKAVVLGELADEARRRINAARIDWEAECAAFIATKQSPHTQAAYTRALAGFKRWLDRNAWSFLDVSPRRADEFIGELRAARSGSGAAMDSDSIRLAVAVCSAFYTFLERRHEVVRNPFRGTRARPRSTWATAEIPTPKETKAIIAAADPVTAAALTVVVETGLRVGGLPGLRIQKDGSWATVTKGKRLTGLEPLTPATRKAIQEAGLPVRAPFAPPTFPDTGRQTRTIPTETQVAQRLKMRLVRIEGPLLAEGVIAAAYSWQDFRHAFATLHAHKGLSWVAAHLGHSSIAITERYFRNVLAVDTKAM